MRHCGEKVVSEAVIAHLRCASGGGGGADRVIFNTVRRLQGGVFGQAVLYLVKKGTTVSGLVDPLHRAGVPCQIIPGGRVFDFSQFFWVRRFVLKNRVGILHCHDAKADIYGFLLRLLHPSLKVVSTLHGWTGKTRRGRLYSRLDKAVLKRFDAVIAVSEHTAAIARDYGIRRLWVVHNGIDPDEWCFESPGRSPQDKAPFTVAFVGRISAEKGPLEFVKIAQAIVLKRPASRFVVMGEGPDLPAMKAAVALSGLDGNFDFCGYQPPETLKAAYGAMDVLILPSRCEGLPMAILEAFSRGVCVAAFSVGGIPELITHGHTGLLVSPGDTAGLATQILTLQQDASLSSRLRVNAREAVVTRFGVQSQVGKLEAIYGDILNPTRVKNTTNIVAT
jgi:glycosyltransferase involved in cell wall biosynthesis